MKSDFMDVNWSSLQGNLGPRKAHVSPLKLNTLLTKLCTLANFYVVVSDKEVFQMDGYCFKCRTKRQIKDARPVTLKNGRPANQGVCPTCGTKMFRIGKA